MKGGYEMTAKKRLLPILVAVLMVFAMMPMSAGTAYAESSGTLTETISYTLDDNGDLTISGEGETPDFNAWGDSSNPLYVNRNDIKTVTVGEGITGIGNGTFYSCINLKKVSLPDSLISIGEGAFNQAIHIREVNLPKHLKIIGSSAFGDCFGLKKITIPSEVERIGEYAFGECFGLDEVRFLGNAPDFSETVPFYACDITAYYPLGNPTWTEEILDYAYGGKVKWVGYCLTHVNAAAVKENVKAATALKTGSYEEVVYCKQCCKEISRKTVTIAKLKPTIKLSATKKTLKKGKTYTLKVSKLAKGDAVKSFKTSKKSVATVTSKGKIKAKKKGKAVITVTLKSGKKATCRITVK